MALHLSRRAAFRFSNEKALNYVLFGTSAFITESRACFENLAAFYGLFLDTYCPSKKKLTKRQSYSVVARSTGHYAWATALQRIRHDLLHQRSLFLAFDTESDGLPAVFSMNWRPGHFGRGDRIEMRALGEIWEGLHKAQSAMQSKIVRIAAGRRR